MREGPNDIAIKVPARPREEGTIWKTIKLEKTIISLFAQLATAWVIGCTSSRTASNNKRKKENIIDKRRREKGYIEKQDCKERT